MLNQAGSVPWRSKPPLKVATVGCMIAIHLDTPCIVFLGFDAPAQNPEVSPETHADDILDDAASL